MYKLLLSQTNIPSTATATPPATPSPLPILSIPDVEVDDDETVVSLDAPLRPVPVVVALGPSLDEPELWMEDPVDVPVWAIAEGTEEVEAAAAAAVILSHRFSLVVVVEYVSMNVGYDSW